MKDHFDKLSRRLRSGAINRRDFLAGAMALGVPLGLAERALADVPRRGGHLIIGLTGAAAGDTLDPALYRSNYMNSVGPQIYDTLAIVDEHVEVRPWLAESWESRPGAKEWIVKLRRGVTFHNGKAMTAADVVYSINHHRGKDSKSAVRAMMEPVTDVKATGPFEVTITLDSGDADLPYLLTDVHVSIGPEGSTFNDGIGTSAFVLENHEPGVKTRVKRNPNDWRQDRGWVDSVESIAINNATARFSAFLSKSVHIIDKVDPNTVALLEKNSQFQLFNIPGTGHVSFPMFADTAPYDSLDMRLALKYAMDREAILQKTLRGHGRVGNDHPIMSVDPFFNADIPQRRYDPDRAKFHYAKTGHSGPLVFTTSETVYAGAVDAAQIFQAGAAKAGITININRVPSDGYFNNVWQKVPFCMTYFGGRPTADLMFSTAYSSNAAWNDTHWRRPKFDQLLIAARSELDRAKRKQMYAEMQLMIHEDGGAIIPIFTNFIDAGLATLRGFVPTPTRQMSGFRAPEKVWFTA